MTGKHEDTGDEGCAGQPSTARGEDDGYDLTRRHLLRTTALGVTGLLGAASSASAQPGGPVQSMEPPLSERWQWDGLGASTLLGEHGDALYVSATDGPRVASLSLTGGRTDEVIAPTEPIEGIALGGTTLVTATEASVSAHNIDGNVDLWTVTRERQSRRVSAVTDQLICLTEWNIDGEEVSTARVAALSMDGNVIAEVPVNWAPWADVLNETSIVFVDAEATVEGGEPVSGGGALVRYDLADGERRWTTYDVGARRGAILEDGIVAVSETAITLFDAATGRQRRRLTFESAVRAFDYDADSLYVGLNSGDLLALRREDWTERWRRELREPPRELAADSGSLIVSGTRLNILNVADGELVWSMDETVDTPSDVLVTDGWLFVGTSDSVHAFVGEAGRTAIAIRDARETSGPAEQISAFFGRMTGRDTLLDRAERAYEQGNYERAQALVEDADRRADVSTAGAGILGIGTMYGTARIRSRWPVRTVEKQKREIEQRYPVQSGALSGHAPEEFLNSLAETIEQMESARGILKISAPETDSLQAYTETVQALKTERDRFKELSIRLAEVPEEDAFRTAWTAELLYRFGTETPEITAYLDGLEAGLDRHLTARAVRSALVEKDATLEEFGDMLVSTTRAVYGPDYEGPDERALLDEVLELAELLVSTPHVVETYDVRPLIVALSQTIEEIRNRTPIPLDGEEKRALRETLAALETIETCIEQRSPDGNAVDDSQIRAFVQDAIDDGAGDRVLMLADRIEAVVAGSWTTEMIATLSDERLVTAVEDVLSDIGYVFENRRMPVAGVHVLSGTRWGDAVTVVVVRADSEESEAAIAEQISTAGADSYLIVGPSDTAEGVQETHQDRATLETMSFDELADLLSNSAIPPILPE